MHAFINSFFVVKSVFVVDLSISWNCTSVIWTLFVLLFMLSEAAYNKTSFFKYRENTHTAGVILYLLVFSNTSVVF